MNTVHADGNWLRLEGNWLRLEGNWLRLEAGCLGAARLYELHSLRIFRNSAQA